MTTSGSINFTLTGDEIIRLAFQEINVYDFDEDIEANDLDYARKKLNLMIKKWQTRGFNLWRWAEGVLFLTNTQSSYYLGTTSTDHAADVSDFVQTTLSAAEASGQTILSLTSTTGMTASDNIGIVQDNNTIKWTTISTVDSSTQVTVAASLSNAAASGNLVFTYTNKLERPLKISEVRRRDKEGTDIPVDELDRKSYFAIPSKTLAGDPINYYYDPQLTLGRIYFYLTPNLVSTIIRFTYARTFHDFDSSSDNADLPQEWLDPIIKGLSYELSLGGKYGVPKEIKDDIKLDFEESLTIAEGFDNQDTSFKWRYKRGR